MIFNGISKEFLLDNEEQYDTIGAFWDEKANIYGLENLVGLGYKWCNNKISYAIGLKNGVIDGYDFTIKLPDTGWTIINGKTDELKDIYDMLYKDGPLKYEIETFTLDGKCKIKYYR